MLLASGGGLILADLISFVWVYQIMALSKLLGFFTTLFADEPDVHEKSTPHSFKEAVIEPFIDYFSRDQAILFLAFILFYKVGDTMASNMTMPFYIDLDFTKTEIGAVVKLFGFWATIIGGLIGGVIILRIGIYSSLWLFGILQGVSTTGFALLSVIGNETWALAAVIAFENLSAGMGTTAFVAFMASLTDKRFTATQYALLSSLMGIPRTVLSAPTGYMAEYMSYEWFFIFCALIALPGLYLLKKFAKPEANE